MRFPRGRSRLVAALVAAALTAVALMLVPGAMATKGKPSPPAKNASSADVLLYRGATTVALDAGAAGALDSLGIAVAPSGKAYASKKGISFPITFGVVDSKSLEGQIRHAGGLKFTKGGTTVYLSRFFIDIDAAPSLSGLVGAAKNTGARADLFSLDLSGLEVEKGKRHVKLSGVTLKLTAGAAAALNGAFGEGATPFAEGLVIGTATVASRTYVRGV